MSTSPNVIVDNTIIGHQVPTTPSFDMTLGTGYHTLVV